MTDRTETPGLSPETGARLRLSRRDLAAGSIPDARMGAVVAAGRPSTVLLARRGDLRRLDLWAGDDGLVVQGWHGDEDVPVDAVHHPPAIAPVAIARLLALTDEAGPAAGAEVFPVPPGDEPWPEGGPVTISELADQVTAGGWPPGTRLAVVARHDRRPNTGVVRVHRSGSTRWAALTGQEVGALRSSGSLTWFAAALRTVGLDTGGPRP